MEMRQALEAENWVEVARQINREWKLRKLLAPGVTTPHIDDLIEKGLTAGAKAGKICGAGGGGCIFFLVDPHDVEKVRKSMHDAGVVSLQAGIDIHGLQVRVD